MQITDTNNNPISSFAGSMPASSFRLFTIRIKDCQAGFSLYADPVSNLTVEARPSGGLSFTNIELTPIDLTPYDGADQDFEIQLTSSALSVITRKQFSLRVSEL